MRPACGMLATFIMLFPSADTITHPTDEETEASRAQPPAQARLGALSPGHSSPGVRWEPGGGGL